MRYGSFLLLVFLGVLVGGGAFIQADPMGSAFSYQGRLSDGGDPAEGIYDFEFSLFDSVEAGNQIGVVRQIDDVKVTRGHFTTELDFGLRLLRGRVAGWR